MRVFTVLVASLVVLGCQQRVCRKDPDCKPIRAAVWAEDPGTKDRKFDDRTDSAIGLVGRNRDIRTWQKDAKQAASRLTPQIGVVWRYDPTNNKSSATIGDIASELLRSRSDPNIKKPVAPAKPSPANNNTPITTTPPITDARVPETALRESPDAFFSPAAPLDSSQPPAAAPVLTDAGTHPRHPGLPRSPTLEVTPVPTHAVGRRTGSAMTVPAMTSAALELPPLPEIPEAKPARFGYPQYLVQGYRGQPIAALLPNLRDNRVAEFHAVDKLPEGLHLDPQTGLISGVPRQRCEERSYKLVAVDRGGTSISNGQIRIRVD